jgi:O-methyltransferase involved in polyketide biosynthesis
METFAFRQPELMQQLHVFEIDHLATQAFKRQRLAELGWELPAHLHFVPLDFTIYPQVSGTASFVDVASSSIITPNRR